MGVFSAKFQSSLALLEGDKNARKHTKTIEGYLLPFATSMHPYSYVFQHDNASIYTAGHTQHWLAGRNITVLDWAAKRSDLNPI